MRALPAVRLRTILAVFGLWAASAGASIIEFTYTGSPGANCATCSATGTGSFSFADSPTSVGLGDLTAFSFVDTLTDSGPPPVTDTFTYSLTDLISFSATLDSSQNVTALALETSFVLSDNLFFSLESFTITSLANAETDACLSNNKVGGCLAAVPATSGSITSITASAIPEPATLALLGIGLAGLGFSRRRKRT